MRLFGFGRQPESTPPQPSVQEQLAAKLAGLEDRLAIKWMETIDLTTSWVDQSERLRGPDGEMFVQMGLDGRSPGDCSNFSTTEELTSARNQCRLLARTNPYARNLHENMVNYVVGPTPNHTIVAKEGEDVSDENKATLQSVLDEWCYENNWGFMQHEMVLRYDRDGEFFLRFHRDGQGVVRLRFVEPGRVYQPGTPDAKLDLFGIRTDPNDIETVLGYWIDGELVDAAEIIHVKANVDSNVRRGVPTTWPIRKLLRLAVSVLDSIGVVSEIQTSIAIIRSHIGATRDGLERKRAAAATVTVSNQVTNQTDYWERFKKGRVIDISDNTKYEFPADGLNCEQYSAGVQAILRGAAACVCFPEFMFTADASNANYASTMVAEGPAVRMFERRQAVLNVPNLKVLWWVLERAAEAGAFPEALLEQVEIQTEPPSVAVRDGLQDAQENQILFVNHILSRQTWASKAGLDDGQEQRNIEEAGAAATVPATPDGAPTTTSDTATAPLTQSTSAAAPSQQQGGTLVKSDAGVQTDLTLNGAQITAALDVLLQVSAGTLVDAAAVALLVSVGIEQARAQSIVAAQTKIEPQKQEPTQVVTPGQQQPPQGTDRKPQEE